MNLLEQLGAEHLWVIKQASEHKIELRVGSKGFLYFISMLNFVAIVCLMFLILSDSSKILLFIAGIIVFVLSISAIRGFWVERFIIFFSGQKNFELITRKGRQVGTLLFPVKLISGFEVCTEFSDASQNFNRSYMNVVAIKSNNKVLAYIGATNAGFVSKSAAQKFCQEIEKMII